MVILAGETKTFQCVVRKLERIGKLSMEVLRGVGEDYS